MKAIIVALVMLWSSVAGAAGLVIGTACTGGPCGNSHTLLNVNAEPFPGGTFLDTSSYARVVTNVGVTQSAAQVWRGTQSIDLDAVGDRLTVPDSDDWRFPGDFSISGYFYGVTPGGFRILWEQIIGAGNRAFYHSVSAAGAIQFLGYVGDAAVININVAGAWIDNTWTHIEVSRYGSTATMWINGVLVGSDATSSGVIDDCNGALYAAGALIASPSLVSYRDAITITSGGWVWNRNHSVPNRRW